jgi:starch phosphorylase
LNLSLARDARTASRRDWYLATAYAVRDRIMHRLIDTMAAHAEADTRRVYYLSLEYLMGRMLQTNLLNTGLYDSAKQALSDLGLEMSDIDAAEVDMGLGNGGLGRLAACFLDSLATLDFPAIGYGVFYEFGLFRQAIVRGRQVEHPDNWLQYPNPWVIMRPEDAVEIQLYGRVAPDFDDKGDYQPRWLETRSLLGIPHDIPIVGYGATTVNFLRLWDSKASQEFDLAVFNQGGYVEAVREKAIGETITKVLYPNDTSESGKELRLVQQYFFVACSLRDIIRRYQQRHGDWTRFADQVAVHLNDTHPALAIPELMRVLADEEHMPWEAAWDICQRVFSYTNHTLLPEALERWSVPLLEKVLPRHLELIYEINRRFLDLEVVARWPEDHGQRQKLSLIEEGDPKHVRMAYLSVLGSHTANGVAKLHTELLKHGLFSDFYALYPTRFQNKTNGITPRRWLKQANPRLASLIDETIGEGWAVELERLTQLERYAEDAAFQERFRAIKLTNKHELAHLIGERCGVAVDPSAMFDVQIKRLHEYKRQLLNLLRILTHYRRLIHDPTLRVEPRVFVFAAKAAPGYDLAKRIIHAINAVAAKINADPRVAQTLKVVFIPDYSVTLAETIIPATDLSEQISTAGKEASGTSNMKLALNGAVTIGTLDGANVEIMEEVGRDNIFIFGHTVDQLVELRRQGYQPRDYYWRHEELKAALDWLGSGFFAESSALAPLVHNLLDGGDPFFVLADFDAYLRAQVSVDQAFGDQRRWTRMAILNTARVGKFSSDRTVRQYADEIWKLSPLQNDGR